ncbi:MAG: hypothetical protein RI894_1576 [Bacteroidota bacterium]|jgi:DHA1 family tetracycline resistance protein-like MFS transporter
MIDQNKAPQNQESATNTGNATNSAAMFTIFITVFLDMVGVGIVIPIIAPLFLNPNAGVAPLAWFAGNWQNIALGFLLGSYSIAQFFGAPLLGAWADRFGRKRILVLALFGTAIGHALFGYGILIKAVWLLFAARIFDGFTGGNISIALSAIADISDEKTKTRNFGLVGAAFGLGFILGPYIGGKLCDPTIVSWFSNTTPFWFASVLSLLNITLVFWRFPETYTPKASKKSANVFAGIQNLLNVRKFPELRNILLVLFLLTFGFSFFTQFFQVYLIHKFQFTPSNIGDTFAYIGLWVAITQGGIMRPLAQRFRPTTILSYTILALAVSFVILLLPNSSYALLATIPLISIFQGLTNPNVTNIVSSLGTSDSQGEILGIQQSAQSLAQALPPIISGFIVTLDIHLPIAVAAAVTLLAAIVFLKGVRV